ncbi:hypothetical protein N7326_07505 [Corynebacterium sp. ES2794-CONJ1]|uniref:hypothetical protein n=1 Tax=unclassified Corynebacterium TaxID=2624378 RepID=UPI0021687AAA|nr:MULTISPECIES: hypothetical protein [unclassified Corynebacterium]MCS4490413.1 hypothetical protein [Corynebacterium sp. ES2775-CONJ]MCS4492193.1 hypothetical protein [Corynebacterium sp. ES2715-CONJ3]MCS4532325.1 hypothetical protein [Corynebacterium sp. ES2730-CONJ]MCU9519712.1 hypothetical protein [Corynebacterium sp. ES2794-CONJ1]
MSEQQKLIDFVESLSNNLNGFLGASVVDLGTGMSLASTSKLSTFDLDVASAYNSEMVKAKFKAIEALGIDSQLKDMLLTLSDQLHLIRMLDGNMFVYVAVYSAQSNLAILRTIVDRNIEAFGLA